MNDKGRSNILEIPVDDMVIQVLHAGQHGTGHKKECISHSLISPGEERSSVPEYCYGMSFRKVAALAETFKKFAVDARYHFVRDSNHPYNLTRRRTTKRVGWQTPARARARTMEKRGRGKRNARC
jgi:hypothetical protein